MVAMAKGPGSAAAAISPPSAKPSTALVISTNRMLLERVYPRIAEAGDDDRVELRPVGGRRRIGVEHRMGGDRYRRARGNVTRAKWRGDRRQIRTIPDLSKCASWRIVSVISRPKCLD